MKALTMDLLLPFLALLGVAAFGEELASPDRRPGTTESSFLGITERGPHHRVWSRVVVQTDEVGNVTAAYTNAAYTELATGMHYWQPAGKAGDGGMWLESCETIEILPQGGGLAREGQHQVYFPGDLYNDTFVLTLPDANRLVSRPLGLSLTDGERNVLIAELKEGSEGQLLASSNQVLYGDICKGCNLDLLCTYRRSSYECDLIIREQLPDPKDCGFLDSSKVWIQWWTEFFDPPEPRKIQRELADGTTETILEFAQMTMPEGRVFLAGGSLDADSEVPVKKQWAVVDGRTFLVEEIPFSAVVETLGRLAPHTASTRPGVLPATDMQLRGSRSVLPELRLPKQTSKALQVSKVDYREMTGLVVDYSLINGGLTNYVFHGGDSWDGTGSYLLSGDVLLSGTNTVFEGGVVLKYASNVTLTVRTPVTWLGSEYRPVAMIAQDDNTMGYDVPAQAGPPGTNYYAATALYFDANSAGTNLAVRNLKVANAKRAIAINGRAGHVLSHIQLVTCGAGLALTNAEISLRNALLDHVLTNFTGSSATGRVEHLTADTADWLNGGLNLYLTNSLLVAVTNAGTYTGQNVSSASSGSGVFAAAVGGYHYLAAGSTNRNAGSTNINGALAADLKKLSTYPPVVYSNVAVTTPTT